MKTSRRARRSLGALTVAATAALALTLTACSSGGGQTSLSGDSGGDGGGDGQLTTLNISMVPVIDAEPLLYAQSHGYYKDAGLNVKFSDTDSGPAVVTAVINGTYDAAYTAWFPAMIAMSKGAPLKFISPVSVSDKDGGTSGIVVKADSPIKDYKDLEGTTVATNALTSLTTLSTKVRLKDEGLDPDGVKFTALPFKASVQAVAQGQVDAAVVVSPFQTEALMNGMRVIADPIKEAMPQGSPGLVLFTSEKTATKKAKALTAFNKATLRAAKELKGDDALRRKIAHTVVGLKEDVAAKVPMPAVATKPISLGSLQEQADMAKEFGYLAKSLKAKDMVAAFAPTQK